MTDQDMSRVLPEFPTPPRRQGIAPRYNWELWLDGRVHALKPDEFGDVYVFRNSAHAYAARKQMRLKTAMIRGEFVLQAFHSCRP